MVSKKQVREFTYYPIPGESECAFAVENRRTPGTYHQCSRIGRQEIGGYKFCIKHAAVVERETCAATRREREGEKL